MMQQVTPKISEIKKMPTTWDKPEKDIHVSVFRAHGTLMLIIEMVNRGDSKESIWNVYDEIYHGVEIVAATVTFGSEPITDSGNSITVPMSGYSNLWDIDLPRYLIHRLMDGEIKTVADLIQLDAKELFKIRGIGNKLGLMVLDARQAVIDNA